MKWGIYTSELDAFIHVAPLDDLRPHVLSTECWCRPLFDDEEDTLLNHNSMDGREAFERGERLPS